jgi:hypothetical protein
VGVRIVEGEIVDAERIVQDLAGVPGDDARLHLVIAAATAKHGR